MEEELVKLAKECVSIMNTSTLKDEELKLWINGGIQDLKRLQIDAENKISEPLIRGAIVMYVKANFGMTDIKEKELAKRTYDLICNNLSLSTEYRIKEVDSNA